MIVGAGCWDPQGIRERLEESQRRLGQRHFGLKLGFGELFAMIDKEIFMLEDLRRDKPMLKLKIDGLIEGWRDYREWLQNHNE